MAEILNALPEIAKAIGGMVVIGSFWLTVQTIYQNQTRKGSTDSQEEESPGGESPEEELASCMSCARFGLCDKSQTAR